MTAARHTRHGDAMMRDGTLIAFPTGETGYEAVEIERMQLSTLLWRSRLVWAALWLALGAGIGAFLA